MNKSTNKIKRRDFIKKAALTTSKITIGASIISLASCSSVWYKILDAVAGAKIPKDRTPLEPVISEIKSSIVIVTNYKVVNPNGKIDKIIAKQMLDEGMKKLTGKSRVEDSWFNIFPNLNQNDTIGIKVNSDNPPLASHPELVNGIIENLIKIGVKENNIIIWDTFEGVRVLQPKGFLFTGLAKSGYTLNTSNQGVRCFSNLTKGIGYDKENLVDIPSAQIKLPITKIISKMCDYLINISVLKDSDIAGITGCLKNYYGSIPLGGGGTIGNIRRMHADNANPQIAELFNNPIIKNRNKLNILDAFLGIYEGGPLGNPQWINGQLIISTDPVSIDYQQYLIIEKKRKEKGLPTISKMAKHIQTAAEMGLGTNHPDQIELREVRL